ncbi:hypothetical protein Aglo02_50760 [Actinokineospora globicatena]|nr:hypothetical protein Aglo02_50760 [Actinokineospora globicatena]
MRTVISNPTALRTAGNAAPVGTNDFGADTVIVNPMPNAVGSPLRVGWLTPANSVGVALGAAAATVAE